LNPSLATPPTPFAQVNGGEPIGFTNQFLPLATSSGINRLNFFEISLFPGVYRISWQVNVSLNGGQVQLWAGPFVGTGNTVAFPVERTTVGTSRSDCQITNTTLFEAPGPVSTVITLRNPTGNPPLTFRPRNGGTSRICVVNIVIELISSPPSLSPTL
jgi:hypothetical protein